MSTNHRSISVALCTYNGAKYLHSQLDSILNQSFPPHEIVIIDDCSTDNTVNIIKQYAANNNIIRYSINEKNLGHLRNFSLAIEKTRGDFVALADQDDIWPKDHIEKLVNSIGEKALCVGDCIMIDDQGKETGKKYSEMKKNSYIPESDIAKAYRIVYNTNPYQGASMLIDRKWAENFLPIPIEAGFHDTYLALCACLTQGIVVLPDIVNKYRIHAGQASEPWQPSIWNELRRKKHFLCWPSKRVIIERILSKAPSIPPEGRVFINEFQHALELDRQNMRFKVLRIKNQHYREIYSCSTYKHIFLRSLHFLIAF